MRAVGWVWVGGRGRERGRQRGKEGERKRGSEGGREGGRERGSKGARERGRKRGDEGARERGSETGTEGRRDGDLGASSHLEINIPVYCRDLDLGAQDGVDVADAHL